MNIDLRQLKNELSDLSDNSSKAEKCNEISRAYLYRDLDLVEHYAHLALNHLVKYEEHPERGRAYQNLGAACFLRQNTQEGFRYYKEALSQAEDDPITKLRVYLGVGINFTWLESFEDAIKYEEAALSIALKENIIPEKIAIFNNLGRIYSMLGEYDLANEYYFSGAHLAKEEESWLRLGYILVGLIRNALKQKALDAMEKYILKLERLMESHDEIWFLGLSKVMYGCYNLMNDNLDMAFMNFEMGMEILKEEAQAYYIFISYTDFIQCLMDKAMYVQAKYMFYDFYQAIETYSIEPGYPIYYKMMSKYYSTLGDIKNFNAFHEEYQKKHDELLSIMKSYF